MRFKFTLVFIVLGLLFCGGVLGQVHKKDTVVFLRFDKRSPYPYGLHYQDTTISIKRTYKMDWFYLPLDFQAKVTISGCSFRDTAKFSWSIFRNTADFSQSKFQNIADFSGSKFGNTGDFSGSRFGNTGDFSGSLFQNFADFRKSQFKNSASFAGSRFKSTASFSFAVFLNSADFAESNFQNSADFAESQFQNSADFAESQFQNSADFSQSKFQNIADFEDLQLYNSTKLSFDFAVLPHLIDFCGNIDLRQSVDFSEADFRYDVNARDNLSRMKNWTDVNFHYINLYHSEIAKVKIDYRHFRLCFYSDRLEDSPLNLNATFVQDTLHLGKAKYSIKDTSLYLTLLKDKPVRNYLQRIFPALNIEDPSGNIWYRILRVLPLYKATHPVIIQPEPVIKVFLQYYSEKQHFPDALPDDEILSIYEKELKNFELSGQEQSRETLDVEYQDFKNKHRGWFWLFLLHNWNCYGYHKEWIFLWTLGFITFFTIITTLLIGELNRNPDDGGVYYIKNIPTYLRSKPWYKRIWYALMYTSTIFFLLSLKIENLNFKNKWGVVYVFLVYSVGLLCLGYMANFVLQK